MKEWFSLLRLISRYVWSVKWERLLILSVWPWMPPDAFGANRESQFTRRACVTYCCSIAPQCCFCGCVATYCWLLLLIVIVSCSSWWGCHCCWLLLVVFAASVLPCCGYFFCHFVVILHAGTRTFFFFYISFPSHAVAPKNELMGDVTRGLKILLFNFWCTLDCNTNAGCRLSQDSSDCFIFFCLFVFYLFIDLTACIDL